MEFHEREAFATLWANVGLYYNKPEEVSRVADYWVLFEPYTFSEVVWALKQHRVTSKAASFFPRPERLILSIVTERAARAWASVEERLLREGRYANMDFDEPIILHIIHALGGWTLWCQMPRIALTSLKTQFCQRYLALSHTNLAKTSQRP